MSRQKLHMRLVIFLVVFYVFDNVTTFRSPRVLSSKLLQGGVSLQNVNLRPSWLAALASSICQFCGASLPSVWVSKQKQYARHPIGYFTPGSL